MWHMQHKWTNQTLLYYPTEMRLGIPDRHRFNFSKRFQRKNYKNYKHSHHSKTQTGNPKQILHSTTSLFSLASSKIPQLNKLIKMSSFLVTSRWAQIINFIETETSNYYTKTKKVQLKSVLFWLKKSQVTLEISSQVFRADLKSVVQP